VLDKAVQSKTRGELGRSFAKAQKSPANSVVATQDEINLYACNGEGTCKVMLKSDSSNLLLDWRSFASSSCAQVSWPRAVWMRLSLLWTLGCILYFVVWWLRRWWCP
jgi:hypothetical protein